ncbi:MAG: sigma-70 family RNA polymerase sigma factor [Holosporales bacterium]|jgi:RNA polymerase sigma-32 factor|nr:sigma-70 family RNA polymerase sigma factor [Holosporales bacterium]
MSYEGRAFDFMTKEEEQEAFREFTQSKSSKSRQAIILSHIRLVKKLAQQYYRMYKVDVNELISEGSIGLLKAIEMFDTSRGLRFSSYAIFWIKAYIRQYIFCTRSIVKRSRRRLQAMEQCSKACSEYWKSAHDTFIPDVSVDQTVGEDESGESILDFMADENANFEEKTIEQDLSQKQRAKFKQAMEKLKERERIVIEKRYFTEKVQSFESIAHELNLTTEGVRQIEKRAIKKMQKEISGSKVARAP